MRVFPIVVDHVGAKHFPGLKLKHLHLSLLLNPLTIASAAADFLLLESPKPAMHFAADLGHHQLNGDP